MIKTILLLITSFFLASCSNILSENAGSETACLGNPNNSPNTRIKYNYGQDGDIDIKVKLKSKGKSGEIFRIILQPTGNQSDEVIIETEGKSGQSPDGTTQNPSWLDAIGTFDGTAGTGHAFILCVPQDVPTGTWYKFNIYVKDKEDPTKNIITIDPRFDVN